MKMKEIYKGLYLYTFPNQFELCHSFFRLQEYFESPIKKLRGNYFTYEQAIHEYAYNDIKKGKPKFTYFTDWGGFNVPGNVVLNFNCLFQDITTKEEKLLEKINYGKAENFYIIGAVQGKLKTMKHEVAHGFYYLNKEYKKEMDEILKKMPKSMKASIKKKLLSMGYCRQVIQDETQAYLSTEIKDGMISIFDYSLHWNYIKSFKRTFEKYYKKVKLRGTKKCKKGRFLIQ